jgi:hypothetical protein
LASRRLPLGIAQAILALLLFAGWTIDGVGASGRPAVSIMADRALCRDLADIPHAPSAEPAIGSEAPLDPAAGIAGFWGETDGDPDLDGMAPDWAMLDRSPGGQQRLVPAGLTAASDRSAAYGATGPPLPSS